MNILQIAGRLGKKPESRFTASGLKVTTFNVAVNVRKGGKEETMWWRVTVWGDRFDKMIAHLDKGSAVIVIGEMGKPEIWTDKEGRSQVSLDITADILKFSPFGNPEGSRAEQGQSQAASNANQSFSDYGMSTSAPYAGAAANQPSSSYGQGRAHSEVDEEAPPF